MSAESRDTISIVMPCFNGAQCLEESIESVLGQSYRNLELIVVDDGSTDNSIEMLRAFQTKDRRLRYFTQSNRGAGPARNRGLEEAGGEFVAFLDADDYWAPDCLEKLHARLSASGAQLAYCGWQNLGLPGGRGEPFVPPDYSKEDKVEAFLGGCRWPIHAALTRRNSVENIGGFDERWTSCMDYDLWLRLVPLVEIVLVPEVLAFYRHHQGTQITKNRTRVAFNHWRIQEEFLRKRPEVLDRLGGRRIRQLTLGELLRRGYVCYWEGDLIAARSIFRAVVKKGYGSLRDWRYLLPSLLPFPIHRSLLGLFRRDE